MIAKTINLIPWALRDRIRRIPFVAPLQRWFFNTFYVGVEQDHRINAGPANGLVFPIRLPDDKLFWTGTWELEFAEKLAGEVPNGGVCLDIGGYRGYFAGVMAVNGASHVHCFEPNPANQFKIERMISLNPDCEIQHHALALGESDGETSFLLMPDETMGKLESSSFQSELSEGERSIDVILRSIDSLIESGEIAAPALM